LSSSVVDVTSAFQPKLAGIGKVSVMEAVDESETGDAIKADGRRRNAYHAERAVKVKRGNPDRKLVHGKRPDVGAAERDGWKRDASAKQAIVFVQEKLGVGGSRTGASVGKQVRSSG